MTAAHRFGAPRAYSSRRLVVSTTTGRVHRADCDHARWIRSSPVVKLAEVPADKLRHLRPCGNCKPPYSPL